VVCLSVFPIATSTKLIGISGLETKIRNLDGHREILRNMLKNMSRTRDYWAYHVRYLGTEFHYADLESAFRQRRPRVIEGQLRIEQPQLASGLGARVGPL
jgi:hypothetical protein